MNNRLDLPGYKYYVDADTGERPALFVTFLNIVPGEGSVNGVVAPVSEDELVSLDARERNYVRRQVELPGVGHAWTYVGSRAARARYARGPSVVALDYLDGVRGAFEALGELELFERSTEPHAVAVRDLRRVDLP